MHYLGHYLIMILMFGLSDYVLKKKCMRSNSMIFAVAVWCLVYLFVTFIDIIYDQ